MRVIVINNPKKYCFGRYQKEIKSPIKYILMVISKINNKDIMDIRFKIDLLYYMNNLIQNFKVLIVIKTK